MKRLRAAIVDDERLARSELRRLLAAHPEIEVVGEAANAAEARRLLAEESPDLMFLDVQMPGETGFDLLASLDAVPLVVFTTAYDEFALRAFEVSALDYLVKPIDPDRLARAIARLIRTESVTPQDSGRGDDEPVLSTSDRIFIKDGDRCWMVDVGRIRLLESEGNYVRVHFDDESPLVHRSLADLEAKLDPRVFFRANRAQIINVNAVETMDVWFKQRLRATMVDGLEVTLSRRRSREFRDRMGI